MEYRYGIKSLMEDGYKFNYDFDYTSMDIEKVSFQLSHTLKTNAEEKDIIVNVFVKIIYGDVMTELVSEGVRAVFNVIPFEDFVKSSTDSDIEVSEPMLINTFVSVGIGALRGMLTKNLKGTPLERCVLPLIPMGVIMDNVQKKH